MPSLTSIILAAHNEEAGIAELLQSIVTAIPTEMHYEIFVAEDGSSDKTRQVVLDLTKRYPFIRISRESHRLGYSKAIQEAIKEIRGNIVMFLDGDGQTDPRDLFRIMQYLVPGHVVVGCRSPRIDTKVRIFQSTLFNFVYKLLGFPKLTDPSSGTIVAFRKDIIEFTNRKLRLEYGFWWEFQAWLNFEDITVIEIPTSHLRRKFGNTKVYLGKKIISLSLTHIIGLFLLKKDLRSSK